jgi:hypothetical protein
VDRDTAVQRINDALGFRPVGHSLTDKIVLRLQEAQRDLEHGKTLPKFLLLEDQTLVLPAGEHQIVLPDRFLRIDDDNLPHYSPNDIEVRWPTYLRQMAYSDAVKWNGASSGTTNFDPSLPGVFVLRSTTIDFIAIAPRDLTLLWSYYRSSMTLETNVTNHWLTFAPEWLIGEAGYRIAFDTRDKDAMALFDDMRQRARSATFADTLLEEQSGGPFVIGALN